MRQMAKRTAAPNTGKRSGRDAAPDSDGDSNTFEILPSQYFDLISRRGLSGEQRLMAALLEDAIDIFRRGIRSCDPHQRLLYLDVERWMIGRESGQQAFSFETVCAALGLDDEVVRSRMLAWRRALVCGDGDEAACAATPRSRS
jgi:hypothetical protein